MPLWASSFEPALTALRLGTRLYSNFNYIRARGFALSGAPDKSQAIENLHSLGDHVSLERPLCYTCSAQGGSQWRSRS